MPFYEFKQNNSFGKFTVNDKLCHMVIIESETILDAIKKAESIGIYFDGVKDGIDCGHCGDRWNEPSSAIEMNEIYGTYKESELEPMQKYDIETTEPENGYCDLIFHSLEGRFQHWADTYSLTTPAVRIYYLSGEVKELNKEK